MAQSEHRREVEVAIIGAGLSGLGATVMLRQAGIEDVVIFERACELGGTWRENTYPGCACDVPSPLYSFSFAPNPDWGRLYASQPEIRAYAHSIADRHQIGRHLQTDTDVLQASWEPRDQRWLIETDRGRW
jgi:cation diffusion facilitator CzcD-associated flavoprotein CzcO